MKSQTANRSEFIRGAIENFEPSGSMRIRLSHTSCTLVVIKRIVECIEQYDEIFPENPSENISPTITDDPRLIKFTDLQFERMDSDVLLNMILAIDFLDIPLMRFLVAKQRGVMHAMSRFDNSAAILALVEGRGSIEARDNDSKTPLHYAAALGHVDIIRILLEAKAAVNVHDRFRNSPLHFAVLKGCDVTVELLLRYAACPNAVDWCRKTPLHLAAAAGLASVVRTLMLHGAVADIEDSVGQTPLHLCAVSNQTCAARALVENGVSRLWSPNNQIAYLMNFSQANIHIRDMGRNKPADLCRDAECRRVLMGSVESAPRGSAATSKRG